MYDNVCGHSLWRSGATYEAQRTNQSTVQIPYCYRGDCPYLYLYLYLYAYPMFVCLTWLQVKSTLEEIICVTTDAKPSPPKVSAVGKVGSMPTIKLVLDDGAAAVGV